MTTDATHLSRRERQIMGIVYELGRATAADVRERLPDPPSYSAVRAMLRILEEKGHIRHEQDGPRYVFLPTVPSPASGFLLFVPRGRVHRLHMTVEEGFKIILSAGMAVPESARAESPVDDR